MADGRAIYIFYGVTNVGKSIFLGNAAANILSQGKVVILITLEMSEHMYAKRTSSHLSRISMDDLASQIEPLKNELHTYKMKNGDGKLIIKEFPPQTVTPMQIKAYIDRLIKKGIKPDAIVIDYMNLIAPPEKGLGSYEAVKKITEMVRAMSYYYECPIISATQTNRSGYNEANPGLETVSESIGLAQTADAQFSIWSEEGDIDLGQIHIGINKNRFGKVGDHTIMEIDYPTLTLTDGSNVGNMFKSDKKIIPGSLIKTNGNLLDTLNAIENSGKKDDN
jgi:replicative DNA helicase